MSFQGDISSLPLCDVFQNLASNRKTGTLAMTAQDVHAAVQFEDGQIISYSDDAGFSIPQWLVDKGIVPEPGMREGLRRYRKSRKKTLGEILRDLGAIPLDEYRDWFTHLVREALCEVLSFQEGSFEFAEGQTPPEFVQREGRKLERKFAPASLIMEAARRTDDWTKIRLHIPSENEIYWISESQRQHLAESTEDELTGEAVQLLDGSRTIRQVIDALPCSRFEACRCLADLIASKKAQPLDSAQAVERSTASGDPQSATACLKVIHEREPNNREVLENLATLYEAQGMLEESAKYNKLLAISWLEEDDLPKGTTHLRKSLQLNPRDIITWQKLWQCTSRSGSREEILAFARRYVRHFLKLGLTEMARDRLLELVRLYPEEREFKIELADARFALGEHKAAITDLMTLGGRLLKQGDDDGAEAIFRHVLRFDRHHQRAQDLCRDIASGRVQERRRRRRRIRTLSIAAAALALLGLLVNREMRVQGRLLDFARTAWAESLIEREGCDEAIRRLERIREEYPLSIVAASRTSGLIEALRQRRGDGLDAAAAEAEPPVGTDLSVETPFPLETELPVEAEAPAETEPGASGFRHEWK